MGTSRGLGSLGVANRAQPPAAAPTVTAANEGLSLSGTTVQLGNASILSALPALTASRHIPVSGFGVQLNSSNVATPNRTAFFGSGFITLTHNAGMGQTIVQLTDVPNGTNNQITDRKITITGGPGPSFVNNGLNAAGAVFASQFINSSTAAAASVVSQWYVDNTVQDFEIVKYSNANIGGGNAGGVDLVHNNAGVPAAALRLLASNASATIQHVVAGKTFLQTGATIITIGDVNNASNTTKAIISDAFQSFTYGKGLQLKLNLDIAGNSYTMGDISAANNSTRIAAEDIISTVRLTAAAETLVQDPAGNHFLKVARSSNTYQFGDIDGFNNNVFLSINDNVSKVEVMQSPAFSFLRLDISNLLFSIGDIDGFTPTQAHLLVNATTGIVETKNARIKTGNPSALLAGLGQWELGQRKAAVVAFDATQYIEAVIDGVLYKIAIAT
jgi:hypothetical protein